MPNPRFPIYIVSKGRWQYERRYTVRALEMMKVPYYIVVEEQEADNYRQAVDPRYGTVLVLDPEYKRKYETCDAYGLSRPTGSGPARNFAWDHAIAHGHEFHWCVDDNIAHWYRFHHNHKIKFYTGTCFYVMEEFVLRFTNVAMAGPQYEFFVPRKRYHPPYIVNTRIYSCNLIRNDVPFRWRGRFNEDTILSLDMLKAGWCTIEFYAILQRKLATQSLPGGNTDELYKRFGTLEKSLMLARVHPDVARVVKRFGRWHHYVDYSRFKNNHLRLKPGITLQQAVNEFNMQLIQYVDYHPRKGGTVAVPWQPED